MVVVDVGRGHWWCDCECSQLTWLLLMLEGATGGLIMNVDTVVDVVVEGPTIGLM